MTKFEILKSMQCWSNFFNKLTGFNITDVVPQFDNTFEGIKNSLETYEDKHSQTITWRRIGEALYSCNEESVLNKLLQYLKSTAGMFLLYRCDVFSTNVYNLLLLPICIIFCRFLREHKDSGGCLIKAHPRQRRLCQVI